MRLCAFILAVLLDVTRFGSDGLGQLGGAIVTIAIVKLFEVNHPVLV